MISRRNPTPKARRPRIRPILVLVLLVTTLGALAPAQAQVILTPESDGINRSGFPDLAGWLTESGAQVDLCECLTDPLGFIVSCHDQPRTWMTYDANLSNPTCLPGEGSHVLRYDWAHLESGAEEEHLADFRVQPRQRRTLIVASNHNGILPDGNTHTTEVTLTAAQAALITDYNALRIRLRTRVRTEGTEDADLNILVLSAELEVPDH